MSVYPGAIDTFQSKDNLPGETYDSTDHVTVWAENFNDLNDAVVAVEDTLGVNPQGTDASVEARLARLEKNWQNAFPVGCIYISTSDNDPATTLGFGTWAAVAEGEVLVGKAPSGTFYIAGATGGEETHTLIESEIPSHAHSKADYWKPSGSSGDQRYWAGTGGTATPTGGWQTGATGGDGAHNNLQPYLVVYMWERIA